MSQNCKEVLSVSSCSLTGDVGRYDVASETLKLLVILALFYHLSLIIDDYNTGRKVIGQFFFYLARQAVSMSITQVNMCSMLDYCHMFT